MIYHDPKPRPGHDVRIHSMFRINVGLDVLLVCHLDRRWHQFNPLCRDVTEEQVRHDDLTLSMRIVVQFSALADTIANSLKPGALRPYYSVRVQRVRRLSPSQSYDGARQR
jgi:hypothetical protein